MGSAGGMTCCKRLRRSGGKGQKPVEAGGRSSQTIGVKEGVKRKLMHCRSVGPDPYLGGGALAIESCWWIRLRRPYRDSPGEAENDTLFRLGGLRAKMLLHVLLYSLVIALGSDLLMQWC